MNIKFKNSTVDYPTAHKVGCLFCNVNYEDMAYLVIQNNNKFAMVDLKTGNVSTKWYDSLDEMSDYNPDDEEIQHELIIK